MRHIAPASILLAAVSLCSSPLPAAFHIMRIDELLTHAGGDSRIQFLELEMFAAGQNLVGGHSLEFYDQHGALIGEFTIPDDVDGRDNGDHILFGTTAFVENSDVPVDFLLPDGLIAPFSGRVCFEAIDCVAYGDFDGDNGTYGTPAPRPTIGGVQALKRVRTDNPRDNSTDYALGDPEPENNAGTAGDVTAAGPLCFFNDNFADDSNWDLPLAGGGFTLENCDGPPPDVFAADIGTHVVEDNRLVITPGANDPVEPVGLSLGDTLGLVGLRTSVVEDGGWSEENHRIRFNVQVTEWMEDLAIFARAHYIFDEETDIFDPATFLGAGYNHEILLPDGGNQTTDIFCDGRGACIFTEIGPSSGSGTTPLNAALGNAPFSPGELYSVVIDSDGDDEVGPLTVRAKIWPASEPEPVHHVASWTWEFGLGGSLGDDHGVVIAALGDVSRPPEAELPQLEVSEFSVCEIPRSQKFVAALQCERVGDVFLNWTNPSDAEDEEIVIRLNGDVLDTLPSDATQYTVIEPPEGDLVISVTNFSGVPVECRICDNQPPVAVIEGPDHESFLPAALAFVTLDSSASSDPEGGELDRFWSVLQEPDVGAAIFVSDISDESVDLELHAEGEYLFQLEVFDRGCDADPTPASAIAQHALTIGPPRGVGPFLRGDCNQDGDNLGSPTDGIFLLSFLFAGGVAPTCLAACDFDADGEVSGSPTDALYFFNFNFLGGPAMLPPIRDCDHSERPEDAELGCEDSFGGCPPRP